MAAMNAGKFVVSSKRKYGVLEIGYEKMLFHRNNRHL